MKITSADYLTSSTTLEGCPEPDLPEFALIGRSNVGKSSLLNALTQRTSLANVSNKPGRTRLINFFAINETWCLVDLPGYGYAKMAKSRRHEFTDMVSTYLAQRDNLLCTLVLIDSNLPPQQIDLDFTQWLMGEGVPFVLVFTKIDKVSAARVQENIDQFTTRMGEFSDNLPMIFTSSAKTKVGMNELHGLVRKVLASQA